MFSSSNNSASSACNISLFSFLFITFIQPTLSQPIPEAASSSASSPTQVPKPKEGNDKKISAPIIIGICVATFLIIMTASIFILRKRRTQKKNERLDREAEEAAEFVRDMEERKRRLGSVYSGDRKRMEKDGFSGISRAPGRRREVEPPRKPEKVVLVPDNLW